MANKKSTKKSAAARRSPKVKDLSPKPAATRMVVGGRRSMITAT
jgi:hypothetical protein